MPRNIRLLFVVILSLQKLVVFGDPSDPFFVQQYDNRNGLSNSSINHIFKDDGNILWVATWDGLNMYDGTSFHVFNYSKEHDFKSIGSNVIQYITGDNAGNIWISTIEGITRFEKRTGKFYNYFYNPNQQGKVSEQEYSLAVDTAGTVYCLNQKSGLTRYDKATDTFLVCTSFPDNSGISKLAFDKANRLWVLNGNGELVNYTVSSGQFKRLHT